MQLEDSYALSGSWPALAELTHSRYFQRVGPGDKGLARVDMVLMGLAEPMRVPLTLG